MCVNLRSWRTCDLAPECSLTSGCDIVAVLFWAGLDPNVFSQNGLWLTWACRSFCFAAQAKIERTNQWAYRSFCLAAQAKITRRTNQNGAAWVIGAYNLSYYLITPSGSTPRIRVSKTCLTLTNFIEKSINIYDIKWVSYKNIFNDKSNGINLIL